MQKKTWTIQSLVSQQLFIPQLNPNAFKLVAAKQKVAGDVAAFNNTLPRRHGNLW
ncbi:hypothetical protein [Pedobacter deserti]|uniref:hypothetical protein n=1 Tax=Pedobacter deserti TaxID=2817382 RepID=UPI00210AFBC4|nr:hypothetical protein [Pedobacter sp. SYSU D00382]